MIGSGPSEAQEIKLRDVSCGSKVLDGRRIEEAQNGCIGGF